MDSYNTAKEEYFKKQKSVFQVPGWAQGWFMFPDGSHFKQVAYRHGLFAAFAACFPSATMGLQALGGASNFALTMNRWGWLMPRLLTIGEHVEKSNAFYVTLAYDSIWWWWRWLRDSERNILCVDLVLNPLV